MVALLAIDSQFLSPEWLSNCLSVASHSQRVAGRGLVQTYACAA